MADTVFFYIFAAIILGGAVLTITRRNAVHSAIFLITTLLGIAGLYLHLHAEFLATVQVVLYVGGIMVLFLFVIMLLNLGALPRLEKVDWKRAVGFVLGVSILAQLVFVVAMGLGALPEPVTMEQAAQSGTAMEIATELFTRYALTFEIIGVLLLVATIGAVMLAQRKFV